MHPEVKTSKAWGSAEVVLIDIHDQNLQRPHYENDLFSDSFRLLDWGIKMLLMKKQSDLLSKLIIEKPRKTKA